MILIENVLVDPRIGTQPFLCDLERCKGACCVSGKQGAPLEVEETEILKQIYSVLRPYLTAEGREVLETQGTSTSPILGKFYTPMMDRPESAYAKACAYSCIDEHGVTRCAIELAFHAKKISFRKPLSCHLYPIRRYPKLPWEVLHYETWEICSSACELGKQVSLPLYRFLQEPLIRCYGEAWYEKLVAILEKKDIT